MQHLMIHSVDVKRPTASQGTSMGESDSFTVVYSALPCMIQPIQAKWLIQYQARTIDCSHTVYTNQNPTIKNGDKLVYGTRTFFVMGIRNLIERGTVTAIDVLEIPNG